MKIAILSNSVESNHLHKKIRDCCSGKEYFVGYIVDDLDDNWGMVTDGAVIISPGRAGALYREKAIDKFVMPSMNEQENFEMYHIMRSLKVNPDDILYSPVDIERYSSSKKMWESITTYDNRRELETLEIHASNKCNLNCKNCSMFCGLVDTPSIYTYDTLSHDLDRIKKYFDHVKIFRVIGGEPLLNKELHLLLTTIRQHFPYTDLRLISNGILIKSMPEELIESIKANRVKLFITTYLPLAERNEELHSYLKSVGVYHEFTRPITHFQKIYDLLGGSTSELRFSTCHWKGSCATLENGRLATCFVPFVLPYASEAFGLNIPEPDTIDLYDECNTTESIRQRMQTPLNICRFCAQSGINAEWELSDEKSLYTISDWSV